METGSRQENASNQQSRAPFRFYRSGKALASQYRFQSLPFFDDKVDRHISQLRIMHYPPPQVAPLPGQLRAGAHSDLGMMTLLYSDNDIGGLEVMDRAGRWVPVPVIDGAFTVNLGDLMMRWANDRWRSTLHRVVNPPAATNDRSRRLSIGMFFIPNYDAVVAPIAAPGEASRYLPITVADYRTSRFASTASEAAPRTTASRGMTFRIAEAKPKAVPMQMRPALVST